MSSVEFKPKLDDTLGCLFLAGIFSSALWGAASIQLYFYYEKYAKSDGRWLKAYIFLIWIMDTVFQILLLQGLYTYIVTNFTNLLILARPERPLIDCDIFAAFIDAMVQFTFVMRVWHLSNRNYILTGVLSALVVTQFTITTVYFGQIYHITQSVQLLRFLTTERVAMIFFVFVDTTIALALTYLLRRRRSGIRRTDTLIKRLILYTISTGMITGIWGIIGLVSAYVRPDSFIYLLVDLVFPKLYLNCILASLNSRSSLRNDIGVNSGLVTIHLSQIQTDPSAMSNAADGHDIENQRSNNKVINVRATQNNDNESGYSTKPNYRVMGTEASAF